MKDIHIQLAHGNGGRLMRELLETLIFPALGCREAFTDASPLAPDKRIPLMTSDSFTVQPLEFPGGNIGSLAVHGTLNDLAVSGAEPAALTLNLVIEEGFAVDTLHRLLESAGAAARAANVPIVGGDTKVVPRGQGSGLVIASTGLGWRDASCALDIRSVQPGDAVLVSGPLGDHGATVLMAREAFGLFSELQSDACCVLPLARAVRDLPGLRFMRDPTRGGLASVLHEILHASSCGSELNEAVIPLRPEVSGVCQLLGFNPLQLACEGRVVAIVAAESANEVLARWQALPEGQSATHIGHLTADEHVILRTPLGGQRYLDELADDPLPRIC
ncbi:hydrogenase expression/formation protein HypE [Uliginosibacterium sp. 31-12]|uniref:hydrogenase expression/formation protein HypE n=1 Tax=Uliginosibacterium sp. 31-12 TaxID=3062781 RepID=UPI0026E13B74|nr:hydrogenase expression/formation protein HypE [Uliginosibacterium sp. 31-12]MDO6385659.1 hydrogenase expression/formation protein HypE [Uliginosibacterium sp. 31-12]